MPNYLAGIVNLKCKHVGRCRMVSFKLDGDAKVICQGRVPLRVGDVRGELVVGILPLNIHVRQ